MGRPRLPDEERRKRKSARARQWEAANPERMKALRRRHYEKNREKYLAKSRAIYHGDLEKGRGLARAWALSRRQWLAAIKLEKGCIDCGFKAHAEALQFDHLPEYEKKFNISHRWGKKKETLVAEIAKCEVRCANCHAVKTALRRLNG